MPTRIWKFVGAVVLVMALAPVSPAASLPAARLKVVQRASATTKNGTAGSLAATFAAPTLAHSVLVLVVTTDGAVGQHAASVTDSAGNAWTLAVDTGFGAAGFMETEIWYAKNAQPATSLTITWATFAGHIVMDAYEISGADRLQPLAGFSTGTQAIDAFGCATSMDPGPPNYLMVGLVSGAERQPMVIIGPFRPAKQLYSGPSLTMRTAYLTPINGLATLEGTWGNSMACSALAIALQPRVS